MTLASSFTTVSRGGLLLRLVNECSVSEAWDPAGIEPQPKLQSFQALWDTGATRSMVSQGVVDACGLLPTSFGDVHHAQGTTKSVPAFLVNIVLPNSVQIIGVPVMWGGFAGFDVLIGMDIITTGDFAVTNRDGNTKFSFRFPSQADIDFVTETKKNVLGNSPSSPSQQTRERLRRKRRSKSP